MPSSGDDDRADGGGEPDGARVVGLQEAPDARREAGEDGGRDGVAALSSGRRQLGRLPEVAGRIPDGASGPAQPVLGLHDQQHAVGRSPPRRHGGAVADVAGDLVDVGQAEAGQRRADEPDGDRIAQALERTAAGRAP
jgi:hypothetical protein